MDHALSCVRTVTVVTTLLDADAYPAEELIELRMTRWMVETNIHHLKITLGMDVLKCKTLDGVRKERLVFPAALQPDPAPDAPRRTPPAVARPSSHGLAVG